MTSLLNQHQTAFLLKTGCEKSEIQRIKDGIFAVESADQMSCCDGTFMPYLKAETLHRTSRFNTSKKPRVLDCLNDLVKARICEEIDDTEASEGRRVSHLYVICDQYPSLFADQDQARLAILIGYLELFGKLDEALLASFFPSVKVMKPEAASLSEPEIKSSVPAEARFRHSGALRVLRDYSLAYRMAQTLRLIAGQIIEDPDLCKALIEADAPVVPVESAPTAFCLGCKKSFEIEVGQKSDCPVLVHIKPTAFSYERVLYRRKRGDLETLPHLVQFLLEQKLDGIVFAQETEWVKCTHCSHIFVAPEMLGDAQKTVDYYSKR